MTEARHILIAEDDPKLLQTLADSFVNRGGMFPVGAKRISLKRPFRTVPFDLTPHSPTACPTCSPQASPARKQRSYRLTVDLALAGQPLQHFRSEIGRPQLAADMAFRQPHGLCQFLDSGELTSLHAPPPAQCLADGP